VLGKVYDGVAVDGRFGLLSKGGTSSFNAVTLKTNDPSVSPPPAALVATGTPDASGRNATVSTADIDVVFDEALHRLAAETGTLSLTTALKDVAVQVVDLPGDQIGLYENGVIWIDADAAGHGWFVDRTPDDDREFLTSGGTLVARSGVAAGQMDLLSVLTHELGHAAGLEHESTGVMKDVLAAGTRTVLGTGSAFTVPDVPAPTLVWENPVVAVPPVMHSAAEVAPAWVDDFLNHSGKTEQERNPNASLRISVPVAAKTTATLKPVLGAFPRQGGS